MLPLRKKRTDETGKSITRQSLATRPKSDIYSKLVAQRATIVCPIPQWHKQTNPMITQPFTTKLCFFITIILYYFLKESF